MLQFEWNPEKVRRNLEKHEVSFEEAATAFGDPLSYTFDDPDHSDEEKRFLPTGLTATGKMIVSHADREDKVCIISARALTKQERKAYEGE